jgi:hypothetical protein
MILLHFFKVITGVLNSDSVYFINVFEEIGIMSSYLPHTVELLYPP